MAPAALSIAFAGSGSGRVTSMPAGLDCPGTCTATFAAGTQVRLAASPGVLSRFGGWSGPCKGAECTTTLHSDTAAVDGGDNVRRGTVWGEDRLIDLDDLVLGGWAIDSASCIDEKGRIAATAVVAEGLRAVLLTPQ